MNLIKQHIPTGHPNRPGTKLEALLAIIFHYTANDRISATDTMNARYFARDWHLGETQELKGQPCEWVMKVLHDDEGVIMPVRVEVPFGYGSAQIIADEDSITEAMPPDETAWAAGDRRLPWEEKFRGQQPAATYIFERRQNYRSVSIEICNNASWQKACKNASDWAVEFLREKKLKVNLEKSLNPNSEDSKPADGEILLLRHYDLTGKICPKPMVNSSQEWETFILRIANQVN